MSDHEQPIAGDQLEAKMANPDAVKDFWASVVKPAAARGKLDKLPTVKGVSPRGRDIARKQNAVLTRSVFSGTASERYRRGYDRIQWHSRGPGNDAA